MIISTSNKNLFGFIKRNMPQDVQVQLVSRRDPLTKIDFNDEGKDLENINFKFKTKRYILTIASQLNTLEVELRYTTPGRLLRYLSGSYSSTHLDFYLSALFPILLANISSKHKFLPFHATTFRVSNQNIMVLGEPGSGKTSLANLATKYGGELKSDNFTLFNGENFFGLRGPVRVDSINKQVEKCNVQYSKVKHNLYEVSYGENEFSTGTIHKIIYMSKGTKYSKKELKPECLYQVIWRDLIYAPEYKLLLELMLKCNLNTEHFVAREHMNFTFERTELPAGAFSKDKEDKTWQFLFS